MNVSVLISLYDWAVGHLDLKLFAICILVWYLLTYKRDQKDHNERVELLKTSFTDEVKDIKQLLDQHIIDETKEFSNLSIAVTSLSKSIEGINLTLAKNYIGKVSLTNPEWELVIHRLNETAEIAFWVAFDKACNKCTGECTYLIEFGKIAQERRLESFHKWEEDAVEPAILEAVKHVDKICYKTTQDYIREIMSICSNPLYVNLPREVLISLLKEKIDVGIRKIKNDWCEELLKFINLGV